VRRARGGRKRLWRQSRVKKVKEEEKGGKKGEEEKGF